MKFWPQRPSSWLPVFHLFRQLSDSKVRWTLALASVLILGSSSISALSPVLLKVIIDKLTGSHISDSVVPAGAAVAAFVACQWLSRTFLAIQSLSVGRADQRLQRSLSLRLFDHVMALPLRFHLNRETGALGQILSNGMLGYRLLVQHLATTVLPVIVELATMVTVLWVMGHPLFLTIIVVSVACHAVAFTFGTAGIADSAREASDAQIQAGAALTDSVLSYETIKSFCAESQVHNHMASMYERTESQWTRMLLRRAINSVQVSTIFAVALAATTYLATVEVQNERMSAGDFVLVNMYVLRIFRPIELLGHAVRDIAQALAFVERLLELFRHAPESCEGPAPRILPNGPGELVFDSVTFSYGDDRYVLRDVSIRVRAGSAVAIVGPSGSGKSTLIRLLLRFYEPSGGRILMDGTSIADVSLTSLRSEIAVVLQDTVLLNESVARNIGVGKAGCSMSQIVEAARLAQAHDMIIGKPDGYDTRVGERGLKLSGGEKQRIAIARAVLKQPRVFVFDEATSALDSETEQRILKSMREISRGTTTLIVAHRLSTVVDCDEILVINRSRIVERGKHSELIQKQGLYDRMWNSQQRRRPAYYTKAI